MAISPLKSDARKLFPTLEQEDATLEEVALEVLGKAFELYEARAKYALVAQVYRFDGDVLKPDDTAARSGLIGMYSSPKAALSAGISAGTQRQGAVAATFWVLPVAHQSPTEWHKELREAVDEHELTSNAVRQEKINHIVDSSTHTPEPCHQWYLRGGAIRICKLHWRHDGGHDDLLDLPECGDDAPLNNPRRLLTLNPDEHEEANDEPEPEHTPDPTQALQGVW